KLNREGRRVRRTFGGAHEANEPAVDRRTHHRRVCASPNSSSGATAVWLGSGSQIRYGGLQRRDSAIVSRTESGDGSGVPAEQRRQAHTQLQGRRREGREGCSQPLAGLRTPPRRTPVQAGTGGRIRSAPAPAIGAQRVYRSSARHYRLT